MPIYTRRRDTAGTHGAKAMARRLRSAQLETRTARLRLPIRRKPYFASLGPGAGLGYRRNRAAGSWMVRVADGRGGNWVRGFAIADDFENADGNTVLTFGEALDRARSLARGKEIDDGKPITIAQALDRYRTDLQARGADPYNAERVRIHVPAGLANRSIAQLTEHELKRWRSQLIERGMSASAVNRTTRAFKAALEAAANQDARVTNQNAWRRGFAGLPDAERSRNVILDDADVRRIVGAAYEDGPAVGLLIETAATTGARVSQIARLEVGDLQADRPDPRLMMPSAKKGRSRKRIDRRPVPIPAGLAAVLKQAAGDRPDHARLLRKPSGEPWKPADHRARFARAAERAGLDPAISIYALRHSAIVRQLLNGAPIRIVATMHDTSVTQIERTYSRYISDHSDTLLRRGLLDLAAPAEGNVLPMPRKG
jgi:integrase